MRTGTAHIKISVDTAKHSESGGILNMKMCPDIYTWVGTLHIATSGESAYYSVSGGCTTHKIIFSVVTRSNCLSNVQISVQLLNLLRFCSDNRCKLCNIGKVNNLLNKSCPEMLCCGDFSHIKLKLWQ